MLHRSITRTGNGAQAQPSGSVGSIGPARYDPHNQRVKGLFPTIMRDRGDAQEAFCQLGRVLKQHPQSTRTTVRAFVDRGLVEELRSGGSLLLDIEAVVPTNGSVPGASLVYFGRNSPERVAPERVRQKEGEILEEVRRMRPVSRRQAFQRVAGAGYELSVLNGHSEEDVKTLLSLYRETFQEYTFEINRAAIEFMLGNSNKVFVARDRAGEIASCIIGEHVAFTVSDGSKVNLWELSDFATFEKDRGAGLNTALQILAVEHIRGLADGSGGHTAIEYAEDRGPWVGVNVSSMKAGLVYCGTLPMHCTIKSVRSVEYGGALGKLESLNVFAAPHPSGQ